MNEMYFEYAPEPDVDTLYQGNIVWTRSQDTEGGTIWVSGLARRTWFELRSNGLGPIRVTPEVER